MLSCLGQLLSLAPQGPAVFWNWGPQEPLGAYYFGTWGGVGGREGSRPSRDQNHGLTSCPSSGPGWGETTRAVRGSHVCDLYALRYRQ